MGPGIHWVRNANGPWTPSRARASRGDDDVGGDDESGGRIPWPLTHYAQGFNIPFRPTPHSNLESFRGQIRGALGFCLNVGFAKQGYVKIYGGLQSRLL